MADDSGGGSSGISPRGLYAGVSGVKRVNYLYAGVGARKPILALWAGADNAKRLIMSPLDMLSGIVLQLERIVVYAYPDATEDSMGSRGDKLYDSSVSPSVSYNTYVNLTVNASNNTITIVNHPVNQKEYVETYFYLYAKLKDNTLVPIHKFGSALSGIVSDTGTLGFAQRRNYRYSGSSSWYIWYVSIVLGTDLSGSGNTQEATNIAPTQNSIRHDCLRVYGNGCIALEMSNFTIGGTTYPFTFVNLLT